MQAFNIKLGKKIINRVFYNDGFTVCEVKQSLVNHDGYDANIVVTKVRRVLKSEYEIQGHYGVHGWECECTEETSKEAKERLKEYQNNCHGVSYRIVHRRVPV